MNTGELIKTLRERKGVSMDQMTEELKRYGVSPSKSMVSRWENNKVDPSMTYAKILAAYFDISLDILIGVEEFKNQDSNNVHDLQKERECLGFFLNDDEIPKVKDYINFLFSQRKE